MTSSNWLCVSGLVCLAALAACGSKEAPIDTMLAAGSGGSPTLAVDNPGSAGKLAAGSGGAGAAGSTQTAAGSGGSAGSAGAAGSAGQVAAGSGGTGGAGGAGGAAGDAPEDDIFGGLFPEVPLSCDGLLCLEDADCSELYPDETKECKLTRCVDFFCQ